MYLKQYIAYGVMLFLVLCALPNIYAQELINQIDANGQRHGLWKKYYEGTQQLRYTGTFNHGAEVGIFKYYCASCDDQVVAVRNFDSIPGACAVTFYTDRGQLVAQGRMQDQKRIGLWTTYHEGGKAVMSKEHYKDDLLDGIKETYYPDGTLAENCPYTQGKRQGICTYYGPGGQRIKTFSYHEDRLQGPVAFFDLSGTLERSGFYDQDRKSGVWKTFVDGVVVKEEHFNSNKQ
jgi:antitoxin component YwqK of YwqJK toxin-antitoxin module